jgi:hypothetical protein
MEETNRLVHIHIHPIQPWPSCLPILQVGINLATTNQLPSDVSSYGK